MIFNDNVKSLLIDAVNSIVADAAKGIAERASFSDIVVDTKKTLDKLGCRLLESVFDEVESIYNTRRDKHRIIVRNRNKTRSILTEFGSICLKHTLYLDKETGRYFFAIDELLQIEKYSRIEQNLQAKLVADATLTSFGKASSLSNDVVSRQTVYNLIKNLKTIEAPVSTTSKDVDEIFIEADEDHIHLNDGTPAEMKLVYVHEGRENTKERVTLKNPRYFVSIDHDPDQIWNDVSDYLVSNYKVYKSRVHLSGDGAAWIKAGIRIMPHVEYHLDKFHLQKALINIARGDKKAQSKLRRAVYEGKREEFYLQSKNIFDSLTNDKTRKSIGDSYLYVRGNLDYISMQNRCSAEGHVSHILSARLSSRPMAWSKVGAERMAKLRAYLYNNGDFVQLIRYGKSTPMLDAVYPSKPLYSQPRNYHDGKGYEIPRYSLPYASDIGYELAYKLKQIIK